MKQEHINEIKGIIVLTIGMIIFASLISFVPEDLSWHTSTPNVPAQNLIRITGAYIAGSLFFVLGYSAYFIVIFLLFWSWNKFTSREIEFSYQKLLSAIILFCVISSLFSLIGSDEATVQFRKGGVIGLVISQYLSHYLGVGAYVVLLGLGALALIVTGEFLLMPF